MWERGGEGGNHVLSNECLNEESYAAVIINRNLLNEGHQRNCRTEKGFLGGRGGGGGGKEEGKPLLTLSCPRDTYFVLFLTDLFQFWELN